MGRVLSTVTTDAATAKQALDAAQTDRVGTGKLMLGRTGQELGNDRLDVRFARLRDEAEPEIRAVLDPRYGGLGPGHPDTATLTTALRDLERPPKPESGADLT